MDQVFLISPVFLLPNKTLVIIISSLETLKSIFPHCILKSVMYQWALQSQFAFTFIGLREECVKCTIYIRMLAASLIVKWLWTQNLDGKKEIQKQVWISNLSSRSLSLSLAALAQTQKCKFSSETSTDKPVEDVTLTKSSPDSA